MTEISNQINSVSYKTLTVCPQELVYSDSVTHYWHTNIIVNMHTHIHTPSCCIDNVNATAIIRAAQDIKPYWQLINEYVTNL